MLVAPLHGQEDGEEDAERQRDRAQHDDHDAHDQREVVLLGGRREADQRAVLAALLGAAQALGEAVPARVQLLHELLLRDVVVVHRPHEVVQDHVHVLVGAVHAQVGRHVRVAQRRRPALDLVERRRPVEAARHPAIEVKVAGAVRVQRLAGQHVLVADLGRGHERQEGVGGVTALLRDGRRHAASPATVGGQRRVVHAVPAGQRALHQLVRAVDPALLHAVPHVLGAGQQRHTQLVPGAEGVVASVARDRAHVGPGGSQGAAARRHLLHGVDHVPLEWRAELAQAHVHLDAGTEALLQRQRLHGVHVEEEALVGAHPLQVGRNHVQQEVAALEARASRQTHGVVGHAVTVEVLSVQLLGGGGELLPGARHRDAVALQHVGAIVERVHVAVQRDGVHLAVDAHRVEATEEGEHIQPIDAGVGRHALGEDLEAVLAASRKVHQKLRREDERVQHRVGTAAKLGVDLSVERREGLAVNDHRGAGALLEERLVSFQVLGDHIQGEHIQNHTLMRTLCHGAGHQAQQQQADEQQEEGVQKGRSTHDEANNSKRDRESEELREKERGITRERASERETKGEYGKWVQWWAIKHSG
mmetsp:Transcript_6385/g.19336  ORF Transcript_6385/g.19336 Transcript_6385/m.19336 type:complete len:590 (-) Transcript_6385:289-2058(-)